MTGRKKLIEVALPLQAINEASTREKSIRHGHPSTLHLWWARRPLAAARAVIFAQMVDDPSSLPEIFPTKEEQDRERQRLFSLLEQLVIWENSTNEELIHQARQEIWKSWKRTCEDNKDHPRASEIYNPDRLPAFHDPFAGGGALPLEAQRLGLESWASDLNPVAVLINKAMIEIPPRFAGKPPVNPESVKDKKLFSEWKGAAGLAEDVRYYGKWMRDEAEKRIGHLYPKIRITPEMVKERPDLKQYQGRDLTVIAWIWARTVKSPNPAFSDVDVPLATTFMLSTKKGKEAFVEPTISGREYLLKVKVEKPQNPDSVLKGTKLSRGANFWCILSGVPITPEHILKEAKEGRMGSKLLAIVVEGERCRVYLSPDMKNEMMVQNEVPVWKPEVLMPQNPRWFSPPLYGLNSYSDLFTPRQLVALTTFSDLIPEAIEKIREDIAAWQKGNITSPWNNKRHLRDGGSGALSYSEAIGVFLSLTISRQANRSSTISFWDKGSEKIQQAFARQALPMTWDFCESNPFSQSSGNWLGQLEFPAKCLDFAVVGPLGVATQDDAQVQVNSMDKVISTDPPYYDNIGYADLSDFFYVWLRHSLYSVYPDLFATMSTPKGEELVATPYRHGSKEKAEEFFLQGMTKAMERLAEQALPSFPVTIYYAFKQSGNEENGTSSTGWETFLGALIRAGFSITGTWPVRTEYTGNLKKEVSALASSIVLVCRKRAHDAPQATRRDFIAALKKELPPALRILQSGNIAPVDLAQAAIGPGMGIFTRYSRVLDAHGNILSVREALSLINEILDETLSEQEGEYDEVTRWSLTWFEQHGFSEGEFGDADTLSKARNVVVHELVDIGIVESRRGKVRLLPPEELPPNWEPEKKGSLTAWEVVHHLARALENGGEMAASELIKKCSNRAETAKDLSYRLYNICERKKWASEAFTYNALVQSWPEIVRLSRAEDGNQDGQGRLFSESEE